MFTVKVKGLKEIQAALRELPKATAKNVMRRVLRARAQLIADRAAEMAPVERGDLRDSIAVSSKLSRGGRRAAPKLSPTAIEVFVGPSQIPHAIWQEFGTEHHAPHPFLRPAWDAHHMEVLDGIAKDMWSEIERAATRRARKLAKQAASEGQE